jgi:hypothetical protein
MYGETPIRALPVGKPSKTYGEGRVCEVAHCEVKLSRYNPNVYCYQHGMTPEEKRREVILARTSRTPRVEG